MPCKGNRKKFLKISAYSGLCGFVIIIKLENHQAFPEIPLHESDKLLMGATESGRSFS